MGDVTREEATTLVDRIVSPTDPPALSADDVADALDAARVVDEQGRGPADDGYVETVDGWYAVAEAFEAKALRQAASPAVEEFSAEGARFKRGLPDFAGLAARYRARSIAGTAAGIAVIELDPQGGYTPRSAGPC